MVLVNKTGDPPHRRLQTNQVLLLLNVQENVASTGGANLDSSIGYSHLQTWSGPNWNLLG